MARQRLIDRREELGLTQQEVAEALGIDTKSYARYEWGQATPRVGRRPVFARVLKWSLAELADALNDNGEASTASGQSVVEWLTMYAAHEQGAKRLGAFEPMTFHALLQTRAYAIAVERTGLAVSDRDVAERVQVRMARQGVLTREPEPLELSVVLDESVFYRVTGSAEVMAAQIQHVIELVEQPNVTVQVLPFEPGVHAAAFGSFSVLTPIGATKPRMACSHDRTGFRYHESPDAVDTHATLFEHLCTVALSPSDSLHLMRTVAKEKYFR